MLAVVRADSLTNQPPTGRRQCDVRGSVGRWSCTPQLGSRVMADVRPARQPSDDGPRSQQRRDENVTSDIGVPEDLVKPPAQQYLRRQAGGSSLCSTERLARI